MCLVSDLLLRRHSIDFTACNQSHLVHSMQPNVSIKRFHMWCPGKQTSRAAQKKHIDHRWKTETKAKCVQAFMSGRCSGHSAALYAPQRPLQPLSRRLLCRLPLSRAGSGSGCGWGSGAAAAGCGWRPCRGSESGYGCGRGAGRARGCTERAGSRGGARVRGRARATAQAAGWHQDKRTVFKGRLHTCGAWARGCAAKAAGCGSGRSWGCGQGGCVEGEGSAR